MDNLSTSSNESIERIDFGGRFARQFFQNWSTNPSTSTPVASDNSICDSGYESFGQTQRKSSASPTNSIPHGSTIDSNNNNINLIPCNNLKQQQQKQPQNLLIQDNQSHPKPSPSTTCNALSVTRPTTVDDLAKLSSGINILLPDLVVRPQRSNSLFTTPTAVSNSLTTTRSSNPWSGQDLFQGFSSVDTIERAALMHRSAASYSEPQYTWSGQLPTRSYKNPVFSCKVFIGGVPWDVTEHGLIETFGKFGPLRVQWPGKDNRHQGSQTKAGYVYLIYESERNVKALLQACTQEFGSGSHPEKYYYQLSSRRMRFKEVQVIPWMAADSNYIRCQTHRPDMNRTVFVGALHGMLTAEGLAKIMNDLFGGVTFVGIDLDKYKYPLGSGRCAFNNQRSYNKAVSAAFIEIKSTHFNKKIQVDPYIEPTMCSTCHVQTGSIFCRDCLRYFCRPCWNWNHSIDSLIGNQHRPLMRKKRDG